jgi:hypothetical protein
MRPDRSVVMSRWLALALLVAGCNEYPLFRVTGFEQASYNNNADILFVIDNSGSMRDNTTQLALNFDFFISQLASTAGSDVPRATLGDAVSNYLRETSSGSAIIDYQLAVTTTSADDAGSPAPGYGGLLLGEPTVISRGVGDVVRQFQQNLLCSTIYWNDNDLTSDENYQVNADGTCPAPRDEVSRQYLQCMCPDGWSEREGAGTEEGLEAALDALCRAAPEPPEECYELGEAGSVPIDPGTEGTNPGFIRESANTLVVIVSDEGDGSRRSATSDADISPYVRAFDAFPQLVRFAVIGPAYDETEGGDCLAGAQVWGVERYQDIVSSTNGRYIPLTELDEACTPTDWGEALTAIGELLNNLATMFPLQSVPDVASIRVYVDEVEIPEGEMDSGKVEDGTAHFVGGWYYEAAENAVAFSSDTVPGYNADVRIYYRPLGGMPRQAPI